MKKTHSFTAFMEAMAEQLARNGKTRTSETYTTTLNSFRRFLRSRNPPCSRITADLMEQYEAWLKGKGLCRNTTSFYMRILRAVYNRAAEAGLTPQNHPFRHVYTGVDKTVKRAVPREAVRALRRMDLSGDPELALARDLFMFSFFTRGMSFVDMAFLRKTDLRGGILSYSRRKTGQPIRVRWESCMQEIVDRYPANPTGYLLPIITREKPSQRAQYLNALAKVNASLKVLSFRLGLGVPVTTYVARHSWASIAYSQEIPLSVISDGLCHNSESTTRISLSSVVNSRVDRANQRILHLV